MPPRQRSVLERLDRSLRTQPRLVTAIVLVWVGLVALVQDTLDSHLWLMVTYAVPVSLAGYGLGWRAGALTALGTSVLLVVHAHRLGLTQPDAIIVVVTRLVSSLGVAGLAALGSAAARARDRSLEEQRSMAQLRRDMVAAFAHDLRSPLAAIMGYAGMIREEAAEAPSGAAVPQILETLDRIEINARQMNELVSDMLAAEQGVSAARPEVSTFSAAELLAELRTELDVLAAARPARLTWTVRPDTPALATDRAKLVSIVRNLVGNALKYGGRCWIRVNVGFEEERDRHVVEVADTGPGIAPEKVPLLFERFYRGTASGDHEGFGLGLFIVRSLTRALGGEISVESEVGRGTRFVVAVPRAAPADAASSSLARAAPPSQGKAQGRELSPPPVLSRQAAH